MIRVSNSALLIAVLALALSCGEAAIAPNAAGANSASLDETDETPPAPASALPNRTLLMTPNDPAMNETAPDVFRTKFETDKGSFIVEVHRDWAPIGADRFYNLTKAGFFDHIKFFRVIKGFMVQFGIHGDPDISRYWSRNTLQDDPVKQSNRRGTITYAKTGQPNSRSTQFFINFADNANLDAQGFAPFGKVVEGMDVVDNLNGEYGGAPSSYQGEITQQGNAFLDKNYPKLDSITSARLVN